MAHVWQWIECNWTAYLRNIHTFRSLLNPETTLSCVVKANAYGHGIEQIIPLLSEAEIDHACAHSFEEAREVCDAGFSGDILLLGPPPLSFPENFSQWERLTFCVYEEQALRRLHEWGMRIGRSLQVHIKLETGTNRQGVGEEALPSLLKMIEQSTHLTVRGVYTHFADVEDTPHQDFAREQLERFNTLSQVIEGAIGHALVRHASATAAFLLLSEAHFDLVRLGIGQYGVWPSGIVRDAAHSCHPSFSLSPVLSWYARICHVKEVKKNESIGYGQSFRADRDMRIAVIPVGYSDGYPRSLSNTGYVMCNGARASVVGRVCMNLMMIDVSAIEGVSTGDPVTLIGEGITVDEVAELSGTVSYEILARLNGKIPRVVV